MSTTDSDEVLCRRLVILMDEAVAPVTAHEAIRLAEAGAGAGAGRVVRRRRPLALAVAGVSLAAVLVAALVVANRNGSGVRPTPRPATGAPMVDTALTPKGWLPIDSGSVQISVPASWQLTESYCSPAPAKPLPAAASLVLLAIPQGHLAFSCAAPAAGIRQVANTPAGYGRLPQTTVNGIPVVAGPQVYTRYYLPALHAAVFASGPLASRILRTLTYSPRAVALSVSRPLARIPVTWKRASSGGLSIAVPRSWPVRSETIYGGFWCTAVHEQQPGQWGVWFDSDTEPFVGSPVCVPDTYPNTRWWSIDGIRVDAHPALAGDPSGPLLPCHRSAGLEVCPLAWPDFDVLLVRVSGPTLPRPEIVEVGLSGAGVTARTILGSLAAVRS
jgi:hypothetical protein